MKQTSTTDRIIRDSLRALLAGRHEGEDAVIVEELRTARGSGRLDMAVVNGKIEGFEIKSDVDSLVRLVRQAEVFGPAVDRMNLVVGERHLEKAIGLVPEWWSVSTARVSKRGKVTLVRIRHGKANPGRDNAALAMLLERGELVALLSWHDLDGGYRSATYNVLVDRVATSLSSTTIADGVRDILKRRAAFRQLDGIGAFGRNAIICSSPSR